MYFRLHSDRSSPGVFLVPPGQPRSVNPHSQDCTMTNICINQALQLLIKRSNSRSETRRGWQAHSHLLPSLPYCVFPLLSTKISLWGRFFSSTFLKKKELLKRKQRFQKLLLWKWKDTVTRLQSLWRCFLSLLPSDQWIFSYGFDLGGPGGVWCTIGCVYVLFLWDCAGSVKRILYCMYLWTFLGRWDFILTRDGGRRLYTAHIYVSEVIFKLRQEMSFPFLSLGFFLYCLRRKTNCY